MDGPFRFRGGVLSLLVAIVVFATLALMPESAYAACGDGIIDCPQENCDDGNLTNGDGCNSYCRNEYGFICPNPTDPMTFNPIGWWRFDEVSGTIAKDDVGANDGTYSIDYLGSWGPLGGITLNAPVFDGTNDYVEIPHAASYLTPQGTLSIWFNAETLPSSGDYKILSKDHLNLGQGGHIYLELKSSGLLRARLQDGTGGLKDDGELCTAATECANGECVLNSAGTDTICDGTARMYYLSGPTISPGVWYHVVLTFGPGGFTMYVDGTAVANDPYTGGLLPVNGTGNVEPWTLGASQSQSSAGTSTPLNGYFDGRIDEFVFYDYQMTDADVGSLRSVMMCQEPGGACTPAAQPTCGDGVLDSFFEECDDANTISGDGCTDRCVVEHCGDGIVNDSTEVCDDGGRRTDDGCDHTCQVEPGYSCTGTPSVCTPTWTCGNGVVEPGEACDDVMTCSSDCQRVFTCGDGFLDSTAGELCDDMNTVAGDGCDDMCQTEPGYTCTNPTANTYWQDSLYPSLCLPSCGDGVLAGYEECDDGNNTTGDGCDERCVIERCGDGFVRGTEACDDGNEVAGDGCSATCTQEAGFVCPAGNTAGPCIPEVVCDPNATWISTVAGITHTHTATCPFNETADADGDGTLDCGTDGQVVGVYRDIPAFEVVAGSTVFALDAYSASSTPVVATIEMAPALTNGSSAGEPDGAFTTIATSVTASGNGNTTQRDFDLEFVADANFSFPGGGLIIRITEISGTASIYQGHSNSQSVTAYIDYDGAYPWDTTYGDWTPWHLPFRLTEGNAACREQNIGYCEPSTSLCAPPTEPLPQTTVWCGSATSSQNCELLDRYSYGTTSGSAGDGSTCGRTYLYRYDYICSVSSTTGNGSCAASASIDATIDRFCESCEDEDPCTSSSFSSTSGCYYPSTGNTTCWDGDPSQQNIGTCRTGTNYCINPGADCINPTFGAYESCDGIDNDCNSTIDDSVLTDAQCNDNNDLTADSCTGGACVYQQLCVNTDTSCGATAPCTDCTALSGWYPTGNSVACCDSGSACTCDEMESRTYYCESGACNYILDPVSPTYVADTATCTSCDDGDQCTTDSCDLSTGACVNTAGDYSVSCYTGPAGTEGVGICRAGTEGCTGGVFSACDDVTPETETCDNEDDDCNGIVDDGAADNACAAGEGCWSGSCDNECTTSTDCPTNNEDCVFENGLSPGRCTDVDTDPCFDVTCPPGKNCYLGSCSNDSCGIHADCTVGSKCYQTGRCLNDPNDRCNGVQCPQGQSCNKGSCKTPCNVNADCNADEACFQDFCNVVTDPCDGVDCQISDTCYQNSCFEQCATDDDCTNPDHVCYEATRCAPAINPCENVICADGESCVSGACYENCAVTTDCLDPGDACYNAERCAVDACDGVQCPTGEACQGGVCYQTCTADIDCSSISADHECWGGFCKLDPCDGVQCATDQTCIDGACYYSCVVDADCSMYGPGHACYNGFCAVDPCDDVLCAQGQSCYEGSCYDDCTGDDCPDPAEVCYDKFRCGDPANPCLGVDCASSEVCYQGACYEDCSTTMTCSDPDDVCYDSLYCAPATDPCFNVQCPFPEQCYGGACYETCVDAADCTNPDHLCYDGRCALSACEGVLCALGEMCFEGVCYQTCTDSIDCSDPTHQCFDSRCQDPCDVANCLAGETCYLGTCYESCMGDLDCSDPSHICYDSRCVDEDDPYCDRVDCPMGEACYRGGCYPSCDDQSDCDPDSVCYDDTCIPTDCGNTVCESEEVCYNGVCYPSCEDGSCDDPSHICYDSSRCAGSACEAQATAVIDEYDDNHLFHEHGRRLHGEQYSIPWVWPRPYEDAGLSFTDWADVDGGANASSNNDALFRRGSARIVIYYDDTDSDSYKLWLIQGSKDASQGDTHATYSIRVEGVDPEIELMDDDNLEAFRETPDAAGWRHIEATVTTEGAETGGIAIGRFRADDPTWEVNIAANFAGDIARWELMNGETGEVHIELFQGEVFTFDNSNFPSDREIQAEFGTKCDTGKDGICSGGTVTECKNWTLRCDQTVLPWEFEACDGVDNTCDGLVDALDPSLKFRVVESRQSFETIWRPWPTVDTTENIAEWVNFSPEGGDDRIGSTDARKRDGTDLQDPEKIYMVMHRNLLTGDFSMPMIVGQETSDPDIVDDIEDQDELNPRLQARSSSSIEEAFVCWYDDRKPASTGDEVLRDYNVSARRASWRSKIDEDGGTVEADTVVVRPIFLEGQTGNPAHFSVDFSLDDLDDFERRWRRYSPTLNDLTLYPYLAFHFRIAATDAAEAYCISDTRTPDGCPLGTYMCTNEGIECSPPNDDNCEAGCFDYDGDGYIRYDPAFCPLGEDCDDDDPDTHPGATEFCNGRDNDCDGLVDVQSDNCASGAESCGPEDCGGLPVCSCPIGVVERPDDPVDTCVCGEALSP